MGYAIKNISELETFNFEGTKCAKETVRKSVDGQKWIIEGDSINDYTLDGILNYIELNANEWRSQSLPL